MHQSPQKPGVLGWNVLERGASNRCRGRDHGSTMLGTEHVS